MKLLFYKILFIAHCSLLIAPGAFAVDIANDTADPLYLNKLGNFTLQTSMDAGDYFQIREIASYGFSNRFSVSADVRYRAGDDNDKKNGFSNLGIMGTYRAGSGATGATDVLFGFGFGGQGVVPNYSDEVYSIGVRTGKQWNMMTLAMSIMTNWIFDDVVDDSAGMAYIDLSPEAYFRMVGGWSLGLGGTFRKSTVSFYDQKWANLKFGPTIGKTGWFVNIGYEFEAEEFRIGGNMNMLF